MVKNKYYKLLALGEDTRQYPGVEVIDPYSRCNTSHTGRGLIFGSEETPVAPRPDIKPEQTIVYELHIRDATIDPASGVQNRGKFLGLTERGTRVSPARRKSSNRLGEESLSSGDGLNTSTRAPCSNAGDCRTGEQDIWAGEVASGLDHIVEMGVTAVQIMPIQDFDNDETNQEEYRWGYMPVHFNSPDGWYASDTTSVVRVTEFKVLVDALHRAGLKVIMDVVYNHTAEDGNELNLAARFSFNGLAPRYYYRNCINTPYAHNGDSTCARRGLGRYGEAPKNCGMCVSNGSGCGNEFRSESPMGRKFVLDSLKYWVNEYKVDGFRFDLLGLIDVDTLTYAAQQLQDIDPNILLYGEPWCGGLTPIQSTEKGMQRSRGFGVFNNSFRDALRGSPFGIEETFVMDGGRVDEVKRGIIGSIDEFTDSPLETINYVECHDNYTLWDHMQFYIGLRADDITFSVADCERIHRLSAVIIFTSQGIPMIQIGQEMCRTKFGEENSYESPDHVNMVRWRTMAEKREMVEYYKGLIRLRRDHPELFAMTSTDDVRTRVSFFEDLGILVAPRCIAYHIAAGSEGSVRFRDTLSASLYTNNRDADSITSAADLDERLEQWAEVVVLLNPNPTDVPFGLPGADECKLWIQVVDDARAGISALGKPFMEKIIVPGRSAAVLRVSSRAETRAFWVEVRLDSITDAYATPADDPPSAYAVGLMLKRTLAEQRKYDEQVRQREAFLEGGMDSSRVVRL